MTEEIRKDKARVLHIIEAIDEIDAYKSGADYFEFEDNRMLQSACIRQLEIIGEAANHISKASQDKLPETEWREIIGLRNILVHEYFGVDIRIIWEIIQNDLPNFRMKIEKLLAMMD